ncbi:MAG TPA: hypothetical protein VGJ86_04280 [Acidimicrobiales bacterium]|jgi:hypothetical protein
MSSTATPHWIRNLPNSVLEMRVGRWLRSIARPSETSPSDGLKQRLNRQLELLRDEIASARRAGLSWSTIGTMVGLAPDTVQSIHAE